MWNTLWNGKAAPCLFEFNGRSGEWLTLTHFRGMKLAWDDLSNPEPFQDWTYADIRDLAEMVATLTHHTRSTEPEKRVEEIAAFNFFHNYCHNIEPSADLEKEAREKTEWEARGVPTVAA